MPIGGEELWGCPAARGPRQPGTIPTPVRQAGPKAGDVSSRSRNRWRGHLLNSLDASSVSHPVSERAETLAQAWQEVTCNGQTA